MTTMDDLRNRFAALDRLPVPDVWDDVERRLAVLGAGARTRDLVAVTPGRPGPVRAGRTTAGARGPGRRRVILLAAAALLAALLVATIAVGSGIVRLSSVVPPSPHPTTARAVIATAAPSVRNPLPSPSPAGPLGGRVIIAHDYVGQVDRGPYDVYALDAGTGAKTLLGTLPGGNALGYEFQRGQQADRMLILGGQGGLISNLGSSTAAGQASGFIASSDVPWISARADAANLNEVYGEGYLLSPRGDRVAAVHIDGFNRPTEILVLDVGGTGVQELALPTGVKGLFVRDWAPDGSAVLAVGCRPCNKAESPTGQQTAHHSHIYVVPLDGSPWRELLDVTNASLGARWSPDGSTLAVTRGACLPGQHMPRCSPGQDTLSLVSVADGKETAMTTVTEMATAPAWSPDGRRIAFVGGKAGEVLKDGGVFVADADGTGATKVADTSESPPPIWSPDGNWLLYRDETGPTSWSIVSADGGEPRRLGAFGGVAW